MAIRLEQRASERKGKFLYGSKEKKTIRKRRGRQKGVWPGDPMAGTDIAARWNYQVSATLFGAGRDLLQRSGPSFSREVGRKRFGKRADPDCDISGAFRSWMRDILPMYKFSVRESYKMIVEKHLIPRFGDTLVSAATPEARRFLVNMEAVQSFITEKREANYAPHSIHHYHEVLRVVLKCA
jgi:hypothetical protein